MNLEIITKHAQLSTSQYTKHTQKINKEIAAMKQAITNEYEDDRASLSLLDDKEYQKRIASLAKRFTKHGLMIVVGIGGSNLGTVALYNALGLHHTTNHPKLLFADTVDIDSLHALGMEMKRCAKAKKKIALCFVTKSGGTTETIANFEYLYAHLKKIQRDAAKNVVVITDQDSKLWNLSPQEGFYRLPIPKKVGGRYSVFSAVGLFPLAVVGVHIPKLINGARSMRFTCLKSPMMNPAAKRAIALYEHKKTCNIADFFVFANDLEHVGKWYRQLMGESIGKQHNKQGKEVFNGITPTVSVGSTDLHSMAQLYLGGPKDKVTTIVSLKSFMSSGKVPLMKHYETLVPHIQQKTISSLMDAIVAGVKAALIQSKRPVLEITLPQKNEFVLGGLLQLCMMEIMMLGVLCNVNPFDQPNVEEYKIVTKKILARK